MNNFKPTRIGYRKERMTLEQIKLKILSYTDFFGGNIPDTERILKAKSKKEISEILWEYECHIDDLCADAKSHLRNLKTSLGIDNN